MLKGEHDFEPEQTVENIMCTDRSPLETESMRYTEVPRGGDYQLQNVLDTERKRLAILYSKTDSQERISQYSINAPSGDDPSLMATGSETQRLIRDQKRSIITDLAPDDRSNMMASFLNSFSEQEEEDERFGLANFGGSNSLE